MRKLKHILIQYLVKHLLVAITIEDLLTITNRGWLYQNRKMSPEEVEALKADATNLKDSVLWRFMTSEIRYLANLQMFEKGVSGEATTFGRAMLHNLNILQQFLDRVSKF